MSRTEFRVGRKHTWLWLTPEEHKVLRHLAINENQTIEEVAANVFRLGLLSLPDGQRYLSYVEAQP